MGKNFLSVLSEYKLKLLWCLGISSAISRYSGFLIFEVAIFYKVAANTVLDKHWISSQGIDTSTYQYLDMQIYRYLSSNSICICMCICIYLYVYVYVNVYVYLCLSLSLSISTSIISIPISISISPKWQIPPSLFSLSVFILFHIKTKPIGIFQ